MHTSNKPLGSAAIEFHDSTAATATTDGATMTVVLSPAYVHLSLGNPGIDSGTGWLQEAVVSLRGCELPKEFPKLPLALFDGSAITGERRYDGLVPVPLKYAGPVSLDLSFENGINVRLSAIEIRIDLVGDPAYLEAFPGA